MFSGSAVLVGSAASPRTGDAALDLVLGHLNDFARDAPGDFDKEIGRKYDLPPQTVDWILKKTGMAPSDAYMAARVARIARQPIEKVADTYRSSRGR